MSQDENALIFNEVSEMLLSSGFAPQTQAYFRYIEQLNEMRKLCAGRNRTEW